jgi:hypothetical protein
MLPHTPLSQTQKGPKKKKKKNLECMKKLLPKENKEDIWKTGIGRHCSLDYWKKEEKENT